uniref:GATA-type domain-containing protein n=1 Tax=Meloidogyne enterolobii TaxID=390850 RepID=A0A6V7XBG3_MELEN|nr:unnamed protein product [Meloidogyne enterolobii]
MCFNCRVTQRKQWYNLLKEHYLCNECRFYKHKYGKFRSKELWLKTGKITPKDRNCFICHVTHTSHWYGYSKLGHNLCSACYQKQQRIKKSTENTKADG